METKTREANSPFFPFVKLRDELEKMNNPPDNTGKREPFDAFVRSLLALNKTSKMFSKEDVKLLNGLLAMWERNKRRHNGN